MPWNFSTNQNWIKWLIVNLYLPELPRVQREIQPILVFAGAEEAVVGSLLWRAAVGCPAPTCLSADLRHLGQHLFHGRSLHSLLLHHHLHHVMSDASVDGPLLETDRLCLWNTPGTLRHRTLVAELPSILVHCLALKVLVALARVGNGGELADCRDRQSSGCAAASGQNQSLDFFLLSPRTKDNYAPEVKDKMEILG